MTSINPEFVRLTEAQDLPPHWATQLGQLLAPELSTADGQLLQERVVALGHGVELAHLRSHLVLQPTMGVWKAVDAEDEKTPWLWLVVLIPAGDPSKYLGWMAHLAAGLHDQRFRHSLITSRNRDKLLVALQRMLQQQIHSFNHKETKTAIPINESGNCQYRLVVTILKEVEYVDHLLSLFVDHNVGGATVIEGRGMAEHLAAHMSLFAGFRSAFKAAGHSQVLLTVVPAERTAEVLELVREAAAGMETPGSGIAFALDVPAAIGLGK